MKRSLGEWLAGFVIAEVQNIGSSTPLTLHIFIQCSEASVVVRCLDRNEQVINGDNGEAIVLCDKRLSLCGPGSIPIGFPHQRPGRLFGRYRQFYRASIAVEASKEVWRQTAYVELDVMPGGLHSPPSNQRESSSGDTDCIHLEMSRKTLMSVGKNNLFLLITREQAARRMQKLIRRKPVLLGQRQAVMLGLSNLMVQLFRGGDTPLLTEDF